MAKCDPMMTDNIIQDLSNNIYNYSQYWSNPNDLWAVKNMELQLVHMNEAYEHFIKNNNLLISTNENNLDVSKLTHLEYEKQSIILEKKMTLIESINCKKEGEKIYIFDINPIIKNKMSLGIVIHGYQYKKLSFVNCMKPLIDKYPNAKIKIDYSKFSEREKEIIWLITQGMVRKEISTILNITLAGVNYHINSIFKKCKVKVMTEFKCLCIFNEWQYQVPGSFINKNRISLII